MLIDVAKTGIENVVDLVNTTNSTAFIDSDIEIGTPQAWEDTEGGNTRNTQLTLTAKEGSGYSGTVDVRYHRVDLVDLPGAVELSYTLTGGDTVEGILGAVANDLGVVVDDVELNIIEVPTVADGSTTTIEVSAVSDSLLYIGMASVTVFPNTTDLDEEVGVTDLNGFDTPES